MQIDINEIECSTGVEDANGATWFVTEIEGWWGVPVIQSIDNPTAHDGGILGESKFGPRPVAITGLCKAPSESTFWASIDTLISQTSFVLTPFPVTVHEATAKTLNVLLSREQRVSFIGKNAFTWELELVALWPFKESAMLLSQPLSGAMTVANGTGVTYPVITLTSAAAGGVTLTNTTTGQALKINGPLPAGTVIDFRNRTVTGPADENLLGLVEPGEENWWTVIPGSNSLSITGTGTFEYRESWQ